MSKINDSVVYLHARVQALEKCTAMLSMIKAVLNESDRFNGRDETFDRVFEELHTRIRAEQGKTWNDIAMWSPLNDKARVLVRKYMEKYVDNKVNWCMENLLPYSMRNSITGNDELKAELRAALFDKPEEPKTTTVEVPIRQIDTTL